MTITKRNYPAIFSVLILLLAVSCQQVTEYPGETWTIADRPEDLGFSSEGLAEAREFSETLNTAAVVIVRNGVIVDEWGKVEEKYNTHSIRKSFLSAMYGRYVKEGIIDIDKTMEELGVDDVEGLTDEEKQATIRDCLKSRSGIYHPALYETQGMRDLRPERHTMSAGTHWYYNNWDFNVLGTIFMEKTGKDLFRALEEDIAIPVQMEHFTAEDGWYVSGDESVHEAYPFRITARDLARFGLLMLREGKWKDEVIVPADWVRESVRYHSDATLYSRDGYSYMWWVARDYNKYPHLPGVDIPEGSYSARGARGHYILVIPDYDLIIVHRVNTDISGNSVSSSEFGELTNMILDSLSEI